MLREPDARIRISSVAAGRPAQLLTLLRRQDLAAQGGFSAEGMLIGDAVGVAELVESLAQQLESEPLPEKGLMLMHAPALLVLSAILPHKDGLPAASFPRRDAWRLLRASGLRNAEEAIGALIEEGLLQARWIELVLSEEYRPWIQRLCSGRLLEMEVTPLPAGTELPSRDELTEDRVRLLFVGQPGKRVLCEAIGNWDLVDEPDEVTDPVAIIALSHVSPGDLRELLASTLQSGSPATSPA